MLIFGVLNERKSNAFLISNSLWLHVQTNTRQTVLKAQISLYCNKFGDALCNGRQLFDKLTARRQKKVVKKKSCALKQLHDFKIQQRFCKRNSRSCVFTCQNRDKRHAFDNINFICECDFYLRNGFLCNLKKNMTNTEFIWKNCASLNASIVYFLVST